VTKKYILKIEKMNIEQIKKDLLGEWVSIAPEIRPSALKNEDGSAKPFYLTRDFKYAANDIFELAIVSSADPSGKIPLANIFIRGHIAWRGDHPIAYGAQKVDFTADDAYQVTPLIAGFADLLNKVASRGYDKWEVGHAQSIFGKSFAPFGLVEGINFKEFDLIYLFNDMLFWGARNVDGRGFDKEENRPTNLQIPLMRKK
jgi:Adenomatosis polyposis coli down-regulated 1